MRACARAERRGELCVARSALTSVITTATTMTETVTNVIIRDDPKSKALMEANEGKIEP